ncbi:uncharacterized protein ACRADG_011555 isoform 1-T2 [Cochliomyia hominivorax]
MPIYHKTSASNGGNHNTAEIDYHTSEAAKVKRTREQAYFNSYDFDAIEVLPYDDEEDEDDERLKERSQTKQMKQREEPVKPQKSLNPHHSFSNDSSSSHSFMNDKHLHSHSYQQKQKQQQQHSHHGNTKYNPTLYLQRISGIFSGKANNNKHQHHHSHSHSHHHGRMSSLSGLRGLGVGVGGGSDIALAVNAIGHDNKHLKLSSSETSSTSLSSSFIIEEIVNVVDDNDDAVVGLGLARDLGVGVVSKGVIATGNVNSSGLVNRSTPLESSRDVIGTRTKSLEVNNTIMTPTITPVNTALAIASNAATTTAAATTTTTTGNNGGNFSLPRAMLKYQQSSTLTQPGASGNTNSMPLATNSSNNNNNNSSNISPSTITRPHQQQSPQQQLSLVPVSLAIRDVHKLDALKGSNNMMPTSGSGNLALRLKKTSTSSSAITSLASEDIEEVVDLDLTADGLKKEDKVLPKTIIKPKVTTRAASHQSHYSTDKSASSGYYSSNVCSTYSLEEHIYSEPTIDLKKLRNHAKEPASATGTAVGTAAVAAVQNSAAPVNTLQNSNKLLPQLGNVQEANNNSVILSLDFNKRYRYADNAPERSQTLPSSKRNSQEFSENLKILESSIENLDRHLKSFPGGNASDTFNPYASVQQNEKLRSASSYHQLPTIQEGKKQNWPEDRSDDSLMDIDLDSFLLDKEANLKHKTNKTIGNNKGLDNPTFLTEEQEENHYKCAKYINSCPEDAYRVESDIHAPARSSISGQSVAVSVDLYPKRYEEQLHFQNTRELLEDVRDKIRLLTQTQESNQQQALASPANSTDPEKEDYIPKELHSMINTLKQELELYLDRMNQHSELEIRQLCTGLVKNQNIVKMKNAFERRRSLTDTPDMYSTYEAIKDGIVMNSQGVPISIRQQITSIRCTSDPNFKMKRKSITEVFPMAECYVESRMETIQQTAPSSDSTPLQESNTSSQMQRNLSYHKPVLEQLNSTSGTTNNTKPVKSNNISSGAESSEANDKESILDWHRKKPSIWEMYYGTNRIQQSLLGGKKNGMMVTNALASSPSTMCYPSSRPESDFTLDMPRAEQLRIKMEKEKKFRQRCRVITTFLSLVFFLLTVMVVSLVLTRGKRMFGSMI